MSPIVKHSALNCASRDSGRSSGSDACFVATGVFEVGLAGLVKVAEAPTGCVVPKTKLPNPAADGVEVLLIGVILLGGKLRPGVDN